MLSDLLKQKEELEKQIEEARTREKGDALAQIKILVAAYGITERDIFSPKRNRFTVPPIYKDAITGKTWSGRGKAPVWLPTDPDARESYRIAT